MSCQPHRVTSGQSNSFHKQIHISKLFSHIYQPSVKWVYKPNHFANIKHTYTIIRHKFRRVSLFNITPVQQISTGNTKAVCLSFECYLWTTWSLHRHLRWPDGPIGTNHSPHSPQPTERHSHLSNNKRRTTNTILLHVPRLNDGCDRTEQLQRPLCITQFRDKRLKSRNSGNCRKD